MSTLDRAARHALPALIILGAIDRLHLLLEFGFRWTGTDEVIFWEMARDYGHGIFHEPYLYAQNYNPALEALLGAPFLWFGLAPWIALPIVTSLLALLPFWSFAVWNQRQGNVAAACVFAAMPLLLPVEFGLLTTITRGFVQGAAVLALLPWTLSITTAWRRHSLSALVIAFALFLNPNALVFAVAAGVVMIHAGWRKPSFWLWSVVGLLPVALAWFAAHGYYDRYPGTIRHSIQDWELQFHPELIALGLSRLDAHFQGLAPLWWPNGHVVLWFLVAAVVLLWRTGSKPMAVATGIALLTMVIALGFYKVHDGVDSIFFSRARMFLAAPLLLAWAASGALAHTLKARRWVIIITLSSAAVFILKQAVLSARVEKHVSQQQGSHVREVPVEEIRSECASIARIAAQHGVDLVVPLRWPDMHQGPEPHFRSYFHCYACSFLVEGMPPTLGPDYDRRHWVNEADRQQPAHTIMFIGGDPEAWKWAHVDGVRIETIPHPTLLTHIAHGNSLPAEELTIAFGVWGWK